MGMPSGHDPEKKFGAHGSQTDLDESVSEHVRSLAEPGVIVRGTESQP